MEWSGVEGRAQWKVPGSLGPLRVEDPLRAVIKASAALHPVTPFIFVLLPRAPYLGLIGLLLFPVGLPLSCHAFLVIPPMFQFHFQLLSVLVLLSSLPLILDFGSFSPLYLLAGKSSKKGKAGHVN